MDLQMFLGVRVEKLNLKETISRKSSMRESRT